MNLLPLISLALLVAVLGAIFLLARQSIAGTQDLAWHAEQLLLKLIPPTGTGSIGEPTWCGLTIRRIAHVVEYGALGLAASALATTLVPSGWVRVAVAIGICFAASLADEGHKVFVPGRHFDPADLALDALGYLIVIGLWQLVAALVAA